MEKKDEFEGILRNNSRIILCYSDKAEDWGWTKEYVEDVYNLITEIPDSEYLNDDVLQNDIGCMFENGLFGPKNISEAVKWYENLLIISLLTFLSPQSKDLPCFSDTTPLPTADVP